MKTFLIGILFLISLSSSGQLKVNKTKYIDIKDVTTDTVIVPNTSIDCFGTLVKYVVEFDSVTQSTHSFTPGGYELISGVRKFVTVGDSIVLDKTDATMITENESGATSYTYVGYIENFPLSFPAGKLKKNIADSGYVYLKITAIEKY